jgi:ribonuclease P protein component
VSVRFLADPAARAPAVAFAVGKAVGHAPARNRVRRRLRAVVRELDRENVLRAGAYLVGVGRGALTMTYSELLATVRGLVEETAR